MTMEKQYDYPDVQCPLMGGIIENEVCFDICLVAEGTSPEYELPVGMEWTPEKAKICMECKNHMD